MVSSKTHHFLSLDPRQSETALGTYQTFLEFKFGLTSISLSAGKLAVKAKYIFALLLKLFANCEEVVGNSGGKSRTS